MRVVLAALLLASGAISGLMLTEAAPSADASCNPGRSATYGPYRVGWYRDPGNPTGVKASIEEYDPFIWPSYAQSGAEVAMKNSTASHYALAGWRKTGLGRESYAQLRDANGTYWTWGAGTKAVGSSTVYQITYSSYYFVFTIGGAHIATQYAGWIPQRVDIYGGVTYLSSQVPGGYGQNGQFGDSAHEYLYGGYYRDSNYQWKAFHWGNGATLYYSPTSSASYFGLYWTTNWWDIEVWDKACQS